MYVTSKKFITHTTSTFQAFTMQEISHFTGQIVDICIRKVPWTPQIFMLVIVVMLWDLNVI